MELRTASEGVSFATRLEREMANQYRRIAVRWPERAVTVEPLRQTAERNAVAIERTYYGTITDAFEGGFCFDLRTEDFETVDDLSAERGWTVAIADARRREEAALRFYEQAASQAAGLLADVSRVFRRVAARRLEAIEVLKTIGSEEEA